MSKKIEIDHITYGDDKIDYPPVPDDDSECDEEESEDWTDVINKLLEPLPDADERVD